MVNIAILREVIYHGPMGLRGPSILWEGSLETVPRVGETVTLEYPDDAPQDYNVVAVRHHPHPVTPLVVIAVSDA